MRRLSCIFILALGAALEISAQAQQSAPPPPWSVGGIEFSGLVDGYYSYNFNHPVSRANQLRNFDLAGGQFDLSMAKIVMEHAPDPAGFRVDLGFGKAFDAIHGAEAGLTAFRNIQQAYISYKPKGGKGLQLDFGKHVTMAGAEVIETHSNWNYSRSLLFALAIPYYHMGLRASVPVGSNFTAGFHLVNGWNNVLDNNSGKTLGLSGAVTAGPVTWSNNYYAGPEKTDQNKGWRHLYDTTFLVNGADGGLVRICRRGPVCAERAGRGGAPPGVVQRPRWFFHGSSPEIEGVHADGRVQDGRGHSEPHRVPEGLVGQAVLRARGGAGLAQEPKHAAGRFCGVLWPEALAMQGM